MSIELTPDQAQEDYVVANMRNYDGFQTGTPHHEEEARLRREFDRMILRVKAEAFEEGGDAVAYNIEYGGEFGPRNPHQEELDILATGD